MILALLAGAGGCFGRPVAGGLTMAVMIAVSVFVPSLAVWEIVSVPTKVDSGVY